MHSPREVVSLALFALFTPLTLESGGGPFQIVTRVLRPFTGIDATVLPYLCLVADDENDDQRQDFGLTNYQLDYYLWLYTPISTDLSVTPETILNNCLDAVDTAIATVNGGQILGEPNTLLPWRAGPVTNCWINGKVLKHVGIVGQGLPSIARIPIRVITGA